MKGEKFNRGKRDLTRQVWENPTRQTWGQRRDTLKGGLSKLYAIDSMVVRLSPHCSPSFREGGESCVVCTGVKGLNNMGPS